MWSYDATYQLSREHRTGATAFCVTHVCDPAGNRLQEVTNDVRRTFTYDAANQLATSDDSSSRTTYTYDASGNLALQAAPSGRTTNTWDAENRLLLVQAPADVINTMSYNADGLRVQKAASYGTSNYLWDGLALLAESDGAGVTQAVYTHQVARYGGLVSGRRKTDAAWIDCYYHYDGLGSTARLTDTTQSVSDSYTYYAFGGVAESSSATDNPFRWVGQLGYYFDTDSVQYYIRARHYSPALARWLSEDPIRSVPVRHLYAYVDNVPGGRVDPSGLCAALGIFGGDGAVQKRDPFDHNDITLNVTDGPLGPLDNFSIDVDCVQPKTSDRCMQGHMRSEGNGERLRCCRELLKKMKDHPAYQSAYELAKAQHCPMSNLRIECAKCTGPCEGFSGVAFPGGKIFLCTNSDMAASSLPWETQEDQFAEIVAHEVVHFSQTCKPKQRPAICGAGDSECMCSLKMEMAAYLMSDAVRLGAFQPNETRDPVADIGSWPGPVFRDVFRGAVGSSCGMRACDPNMIRDLNMDAMYRWFLNHDWSDMLPGLTWQQAVE